MTEKSTFARRVRAAKARPTKYEVRDDVVIGLALAIQPTGVRSYFLSRMVRGRRRYANIGNADAMTIPEARREARRLIASYIEPAKKDSGPRTPGHPMTAFAEEFLDRQAHRWKPRTQETNSYAEARGQSSLIACWRTVCADAKLGSLIAEAMAGDSW